MHSSLVVDDGAVPPISDNETKTIEKPTPNVPVLNTMNLNNVRPSDKSTPRGSIVKGMGQEKKPVSSGPNMHAEVVENIIEESDENSDSD